MKILVLNGSPKREKSNSMRLARAFLDGVQDATSAQIELLHVAQLHIRPCTGCLSCWSRTAGRCVVTGDDVANIIDKIMAADVVLEVFPLYFCGIPGPMKTLMDRLLPLFNTYLGGNLREGEALHGLRYDMSGKRLVLVSTCGYGEVDPMYDAVRAQFDYVCGKGHYTALFCPQGEVFRAPSGQVRGAERRMTLLRNAGAEFARNGRVSEDTVKAVATPMFSERTFRTLLDMVMMKGE